MLNAAQILANIEKHTSLIEETHAYIWAHPETGYREWGTSKYLEDRFEALGYELVRAGNIPGFYTDIDTGVPGPKVLIMGELDSLINADHPQCDKKTGAVHSCGHSAQVSALLGIAAALKEPGALDGLCGSVRLMAVPAEELIEIGYREELRRQGIIKYFGGKVEFMYRGYMDGVDIAFMFHTSNMGEKSFGASRGSNGCVTKKITFTGKSAHAGGAPHMGVNALYAANLALDACNALRETFKDADHIRFHPIITRGGDAVNAIPSNVVMESYVRGANIDCIRDANWRVNRAIAASAAALGAKVTLADRPGYYPLINDQRLLSIAEKAMLQCAPREMVEVTDNWGTGCTDMGDVSSVIPAVHPYCAGATGTGHGADYYVSDVYRACIKAAQCQMVMLSLLLCDGAAAGLDVVKNSHTIYGSMKEYFEVADSLYMDKEAVEYDGDTVILR